MTLGSSRQKALLTFILLFALAPMLVAADGKALARHHYAKGEDLAGEGLHRMAIPHFYKALKAHESSVVRVALAESFKALGDKGRAYREFLTAAKAASTDPSILVRTADMALDFKRLDDALQIIKKLQEVDEEMSTLLYERYLIARGDEEARASNFLKAYRLYTKAEKVGGPSLSIFTRRLASLQAYVRKLEKEGKKEMLIKALEKLNALQPDEALGKRIDGLREPQKGI